MAQRHVETDWPIFNKNHTVTSQPQTYYINLTLHTFIRSSHGTPNIPTLSTLIRWQTRHSPAWLPREP